MKILRSIGAVIAGFASVVVLSVATDALCEKWGIFYSMASGAMLTTWMLFLALLYRSVYTVIGGYVTAKLSPSNPMKHVTALGIIGTLAGITGVIVGWNLSAHWYPIAIALTGFMFAWYGGRLQTRSEIV
jgi:hypothetical protein